MPEPNEYPAVVTLRFRSPSEAEAALHELGESYSVVYNDGEIGQNIYYVDAPIAEGTHHDEED